MRRRIMLVAAVAGVAACTLNPQPLPPGQDTNPDSPGESKGTAFADSGSLADGGASAPADAGVGADAGGDSASPPPVGDAGADAADARADARDATGD